jgi:hypothetical protein
MISLIGLYFYDFVLTLQSEVKFYEGKRRQRKMLAKLIALRYLPALYQIGIVLAVINNDWTPTVGY